MISIPSSIVYFVLGFITCVCIVVIIFVHIVRKENKAKQEIMDNLFKNINNDDSDNIVIKNIKKDE